MSIPLNYIYTGEKQPSQEGERDSTFNRRYYPYIPSEDLKEVVNLSIDLERPLLLEGEPGCGKTRLANAIVYEYTKRHLQEQTDDQGNPRWWPFYIWNVKSTARARDGLYCFDAIARLRDAQLIGNTLELKEFSEDKRQELIKRLNDPKRYRQFGPLGNALRPKTDPKDQWQRDYRPVLLIDEVDKADSDFANDLLREMDEMQFDIPETEEWNIAPEQKPIILITSNREKPLPEPFLRRCIYYYVSFPDAKLLKEIVTRRFGDKTIEKKKLVEAAVKHFYEIRELLEEQPGSKPPGTSEFIEFLGVLLNKRTPADAMKDLRNLAKRLPLLGTLLKNQSDQQLYREKFQ